MSLEKAEASRVESGRGQARPLPRAFEFPGPGRVAWSLTAPEGLVFVE